MNDRVAGLRELRARINARTADWPQDQRAKMLALFDSEAAAPASGGLEEHPGRPAGACSSWPFCPRVAGDKYEPELGEIELLAAIAHVPRGSLEQAIEDYFESEDLVLSDELVTGLAARLAREETEGGR